MKHLRVLASVSFNSAKQCLFLKPTERNLDEQSVPGNSTQEGPKSVEVINILFEICTWYASKHTTKIYETFFPLPPSPGYKLDFNTKTQNTKISARMRSLFPLSLD